MPITSVFGKLRTEEFKASLGYIAKLHPKERGRPNGIITGEMGSKKSADRLYSSGWEKDVSQQITLKCQVP